MMEIRLRLADFAACALLALLPVACKEKSDEPASADSATEPLSPGDHPEAKRKHELPPAAFDACQSKGVGDACTVSYGAKQVEAKCAAAPDGRLACRPERGKHPPEGT